MAPRLRASAESTEPPGGQRPGVLGRARRRGTGGSGAARRSASQPPRAQSEAFDGHHRVATARGGVAAAGWPQRADRHSGRSRISLTSTPAILIGVRSTGRGRRRGRRRTGRRSRSRAGGRARTTVALPAGRRWSRGASWARSRRLTWWRTTLPPTDRPTTSPTIGAVRPGSATSVERVRRCTTSVRRPARRPARTVSVKSAERRIRLAGGSTGGSDGGDGLGGLRPRARRGPCDDGWR